MHIRLCGDTATVEAGTPHLVLFDNHYMQSLSGGILSGAVTTRSRADNNQVSCCHSSSVYKSQSDAWRQARRPPCR